MTVVLLGPQRVKPNLAERLVELGADGQVAMVTAGWQEREDDDQALRDHLQDRAVNLRLYARAEEVFRDDHELAAAYRARQDRLRQAQELYRLRLELALDALRLLGRQPVAPDLLAEETQACIEAVRVLDAGHLERCRRLHADFESRLRPSERPVVARHRAEIAAALEHSAALAIAGGHVAVLLNRLKLFGVAGLMGGCAVLAWSAGAMAISERVVLFHDSPPQGAGHAEILDAGLGLCRGVVALPSPRLRLRLEDRGRVAVLARRFAPAACLAMDDASYIRFNGANRPSSSGIVRLLESGGLDRAGPR